MRKEDVNSFVQFVTQSDFLDLISELVLFRGQPVDFHAALIRFSIER